MDKIFARLAELESKLRVIAYQTESTVNNEDERALKIMVAASGTRMAADMARQIASELALEGWRR